MWVNPSLTLALAGGVVVLDEECGVEFHEYVTPSVSIPSYMPSQGSIRQLIPRAGSMR
jgi:hypothetical protein